jgi:4-hydroxybenzoate polyprenyltransferase
MAPYLMNHYLRKYLITIWFVLSYRRHHTFDVKACFQQNRYVFDVIVTSWALFVFCISWNFARDISTVFEEIKHLRSRAPDNIYKIIKINKTQLLLKYFFGARGVKFLEKRWEYVQIFQALIWRFDIWGAIFALKNDGMSSRNSYIQM